MRAPKKRWFGAGANNLWSNPANWNSSTAIGVPAANYPGQFDRALTVWITCPSCPGALGGEIATVIIDKPGSVVAFTSMSIYQIASITVNATAGATLKLNSGNLYSAFVQVNLHSTIIFNCARRFLALRARLKKLLISGGVLTIGMFNGDNNHYRCQIFNMVL